MVKNIRWLYAKLGNTDFATTGTTVSGALKNLNTSVNGKANGSHKHTVSDIPATSQQINSDSYIPLSSLVYSMSQQIKSISDTFNSHINPDSVTEDLTIDYNMINVTDDITQMHVYGLTTSNTTSESHYLYNTDDFFNTFNRSTGYTNTNLDQKLYIGDVIIPAETNDVQQAWVVAGFDVEKNGITHEGSLPPYAHINDSLGYTTSGDSYDNGYGIALVLIDRFDINGDSADYSSYYTNYNSIYGTNGFDYPNSNINTSVIPLIVNDAKNIMFKDHIVERNIIAYTGEDVNGDYSWTTAYGTLLHSIQLLADPNQSISTDNTEASYILPISYYCYNGLSSINNNYLYDNSMGYFGPVWVRDTGTSDKHYYTLYYNGWLLIEGLSSDLTSIETSLPIRPMIYVR